MGVSTFAGYAAMLITIPIYGYLVKLARRIQVKIMTAKDVRTKRINEMLSGIRLLKVYAWEPACSDRILKLRENELNLQKTGAYFRSGIVIKINEVSA